MKCQSKNKQLAKQHEKDEQLWKQVCEKLDELIANEYKLQAKNKQLQKEVEDWKGYYGEWRGVANYRQKTIDELATEIENKDNIIEAESKRITELKRALKDK